MLPLGKESQSKLLVERI